jgi:isopentenyldiphosphate isomerase
MVKYPPLPVVNKDDERVGEAMLEEILEKGLLHRVVHVWVEDPEGNVLLQLRGSQVAANPNTWDFAAAGYVDLGENYEQAAHRELAEELGLSGIELQNAGVVREKETINGREVNRFAGTFKAAILADADFKLQANEVAKVKWFTGIELQNLVESHSVEVTPYFTKWVQEHYFGHEDNEH